MYKWTEPSPGYHELRHKGRRLGSIVFGRLSLIARMERSDKCKTFGYRVLGFTSERRKQKKLQEAKDWLEFTVIASNG